MCQSCTKLYENVEAEIRAILMDSLSVEYLEMSYPPAFPCDGDIFIVGQNAIGDWDGHEGQIAVYKDQWRFYQLTAV